MRITGQSWQPAIPAPSEGDPKTAALRAQSTKVELAAHRVITQPLAEKQNRALPVAPLQSDETDKVFKAADRVI
ncbi:MAG: hypothetical protein V4492_04950 [Chlamydiota bacterium]